MAEEIVFNAHANSIDLCLKAKGVALTDDEMDAITQITVTVEDTLISTLAANKATGPIKWRQAGYEGGAIHIGLGAQSLAEGKYRCWVVIRDDDHPTGFVWGNKGFDLRVREDVEASEE